MNLILFGLPSSGKTTVGLRLAAHLSLPFIDTDKIIEEHYQEQFKLNYSCREIYQTLGEKRFRVLECQAVFSLQNQSSTIISLGGGAICNPKIVWFLQKLGKFVYLHITIQALHARLILDPPAFLSKIEDIDYFNDFYDKRLQYMKKIPSHTIDVDNKTLEEIVDLLSNFYILI